MNWRSKIFVGVNAALLIWNFWGMTTHAHDRPMSIPKASHI